MKINKKLQGIYFLWSNEYYEPAPRSWNDTFENYLYFTRYDFADNWSEKILNECNIDTKEEFEEQINLIEVEYKRYAFLQEQKRNRQRDKKLRKAKRRNPLLVDELPF